MTIFQGIGGSTAFSNKLIKEVEHSQTPSLSLKSRLQSYRINTNYIRFRIETNTRQRAIIPENLYTAMVFRGYDIPLLSTYYEAVKMDNLIYYWNKGLHVSGVDNFNMTNRLFENGKDYKRDLIHSYDIKLLVQYKEKFLCLLK